MSRAIRIGIVGAGLMGHWHAHAARHANAKIVAIADLDIDRARRLASRYNASAHATAGDLMDRADISLLHICAPTDAHLPIAMMAIDRNLHLLIEKPLSASQPETLTILQKAKSAQKLVCPSHQYAFQRSVNKTINQLKRAGEVITVDLKFCTAGGAGFDPSSFPLLAADILPHPLSILQRIFPSKQISKSEWRLASSRNGDWEISTQIDRTRIRITLSLLARPTVASLIVAGTKGSFEADLFHDYVVWSGGEVTRSTKILQPFTRSLAHLWFASQNLAFRAVSSEPAYPGLNTLTSKFYEACNTGAEAPITEQQMIDISAMRDRFLQAAQSGGDILESVNFSQGASS